MKRVLTILAAFGLILHLGCSPTTIQNRPVNIQYTAPDSGALSSPNKGINSFVIEAANNPGLANDVKGSVFFDSVKLVFFPGTVVSSLSPTITFTGQSITPGSGVPQDFDSVVSYLVTATDGSILHFKVVATFR
jgi:hypothetical protein